MFLYEQFIKKNLACGEKEWDKWGIKFSEKKTAKSAGITQADQMN